MNTGAASVPGDADRAAEPLVHVHYISSCIVPAAALDLEIAMIARTSVGHNADAGITGALVYARGWFTQVLEGPAPAVDSLMQRIVRDRRHRDCVTIQRRPITAPAFSNWSLVYRGGSIFVASAIERAATAALQGRFAETDTLLRLMAAFARAGAPPQG